MRFYSAALWSTTRQEVEFWNVSCRVRRNSSPPPGCTVPQRGEGQPACEAFQLGAGCFAQDEEHGGAAVGVEGTFADQLVPFAVFPGLGGTPRVW